MNARIVSLAVYRAEHPRPVARVRWAFDPLWAWRWWLAWWGIR